VALIYDFDGTLAQGNIQEHSLLEALGTTKRAFWEEVVARAERQDADGVLVYLEQLLDLARARGIDLTRDFLAQHGAGTPLFPGVAEWFERIDRYAASIGLRTLHYIVSSGNHEMIEGTPIASRFRKIFACKYLYGDDGIARWPAVVVNYTTKTQFLFRINKGIENCHDHKAINEWIDPEDRPVPFPRMIFFGDGDTDIPAMKLVRELGGYSFAVFDPDQWAEPECQEKIHKLMAEDRVSYVAGGDYRDTSLLDVSVKGVLQRIRRLSC